MMDDANPFGRYESLPDLVEAVRIRTNTRERVVEVAQRQVRRGWGYDALIDLGIMDSVASGQMTRKLAFEVLQGKYPKRRSLSMADVNRWVNAFLEDENILAEAEGWAIDPRHVKMLGPSDDDMRQLLEDDPDGFEVSLGEMVEAFASWRDEFIVDGKNKPKFVNTDQHKDWIRETLRTIYTGGRLQLLVSPRMGKSYLMCDFCLWSICRNPDIAILWIGGSMDMAYQMTGIVRDHLENNDALRKAFLGPGAAWKPAGRGAGTSWTSNVFTVGNRSLIGQKAPTMTGVGKQTKILSRDCDLIICDDIEDHDSSYTEGAREKQNAWFSTQVESRKEGNTGLVLIGSRQHPQDMYGRHLDDESGMWNCMTYPAHDPTCDIDPTDVKAHTDCVMLYPIRDYKWLHEQKKSLESRGQGSIFQMVYLNDPIPEGAVIFPPKVIDAALDPARKFGLEDIPDNVILVAGIDPAAGGTQACAVWAFQKPADEYRGRYNESMSRGRLWLVDLDLRPGTNVASAFAVMRLMTERYPRLEHFVIESNSFQQAIHDDRGVKAWSRENGIAIEAHRTSGQTKHHQEFGVAGIRSWFDDGAISLPYHPGRTKEAVRTLRRQFINYEGEAAAGRRKRGKDDALMACWFPFKVFHKSRREISREVKYTYDAAYPMVGRGWSSAPWETIYPTSV